MASSRRYITGCGVALLFFYAIGYSYSSAAQSLPLSLTDRPKINAMERRAGVLHIKIDGSWYRLAQDAEIFYCNEKSTSSILAQYRGYPVDFSTDKRHAITSIRLSCE